MFLRRVYVVEVGPSDQPQPTGLYCWPFGPLQLGRQCMRPFEVSNVSERWMYIPVHLPAQRILEKKKTTNNFLYVKRISCYCENDVSHMLSDFLTLYHRIIVVLLLQQPTAARCTWYLYFCYCLLFLFFCMCVSAFIVN